MILDSNKKILLKMVNKIENMLITYELSTYFFYSTVTDFAKFLGLSIEQPLSLAQKYAIN